jgi:hypothetical protein
MGFWAFFIFWAFIFHIYLSLFCHIFWAYFALLAEKHAIFSIYFTYILQTTKSLKPTNVNKTNITSLQHMALKIPLA